MADGGDGFDGCIEVVQRTRGYLRDLFTRLANGHLDKDIDALMPWAYAAAPHPLTMSSSGSPQ